MKQQNSDQLHVLEALEARILLSGDAAELFLPGSTPAAEVLLGSGGAPAGSGELEMDGGDLYAVPMSDPILLPMSGYNTGTTEQPSISLSEAVVINAGQTHTFRATAGGITIQSPGTVDGTLPNANAPGGTEESLILDATGNIQIFGAVGNNAKLHNLTILNGANITFRDEIHLTGDLIIEQGAQITFERDVRILGNLMIGDASDLSKIGSVTFTPAARLDVEGDIRIFSNGTVNFRADVGQVYGIDTLEVRSNNLVNFEGRLTVNAADIQAGTDHDVYFNQQVQVQEMAASAGNLIRVDSTIRVGTGDLTLTMNRLELLGGAGSLFNQSGTNGMSVLTLKPFDPGRHMAVGEPALLAPLQVLEISNREIGAISTGFVEVVFGDLEHAANLVEVANFGRSLAQPGAPRIQNPTTVVGGRVEVGYATAVGFDTFVNAWDVADYLRFKSLVDDVVVDAAINEWSFQRNNWIRIEAERDIIINRPIFALERISLTAGYSGAIAGSVILNSTGTESGQLHTTGTGAGQRIEISAGRTAGNIVMSDQTGAVTVWAAGLNSELLMQAPGGAITQTGGLIRGTLLAATADGNVSLALTDVERIGAGTIDGVTLWKAGEIKDAGDDVDINGIVITGGGSLTLVETDDLVIDHVLTAGGSIVMSNVAGNEGDFHLGVLNAVSGGITLTVDGAIFDNLAGGGQVNLETTGHVALTAKTGIGLPGTGDLDTRIGSLQAQTTVSGGIFIEERDGLNITGPLRTAGDGSIHVGLQNGNLVVSDEMTADGTGNIRLLVEVGTLDVDAEVASGTGHITLHASGTIAFGADGEVFTANPGTVSVLSQTGDLLMHAEAGITAESSSLRMEAPGMILLGGLAAERIAVVSASNSVRRAPGAALNVEAEELRISAGQGIGTAGAPLLLAVDAISTLSNFGTYLRQDGDMEVTEIAPVQVQVVQASDLTVDRSDALDQAGLVTLSDGDIVLVAEGSLTVDEAGFVTANGLGNIRLEASGTGADLDLQSLVSSLLGHISLIAARNLDLQADVWVTTQGSIYARAVAGAITLDPTALIFADGENVGLHAEGNVSLGVVVGGDVAVTSDSGSIFAQPLLDLDITLSDINLIANTLRLEADGAIGVVNPGLGILAPIRTSVLTLSAAARGQVPAEAGAHLLNFGTDLTVGSVAVTVLEVEVDAQLDPVTFAAQADVRAMNSGSIVLVTREGDLDLTDGDTNGWVLKTDGSGEIAVAVEGELRMEDGVRIESENGDVLLQARDDISLSVIESETGDVFIYSDTGAIIDHLTAETPNVITPGHLMLRAANGIGEVNNADLNTRVGSLNALNTTDGLIVITEETGLSIAAPFDPLFSELEDMGLHNLALNGSVLLETLEGSITVDASVFAAAGGRIRIAAVGEDTDLTVNAAVTAAGGAITLFAEQDLLVNRAVRAVDGGTILLAAMSRDLRFSATGEAVTADENIFLRAGGDLAVTGVNAGVADVSLYAMTGSISDAGDVSEFDVVARRLRMFAQGSIGAGNPLELKIEELSATSTSGSIDLINNGDLTITQIPPVQVHFVFMNNTTSLEGDLLPSGMGVFARDAISITSLNGSIIMVDGTGVRSELAGVTLTAAEDILLSRVISEDGGTLRIDAGGAIIDNTGDEDPNLETSGLADLSAGSGIGGFGAADINTRVGSLQAVNRSSGDIVIREEAGLVIASGGVVTEAGNGNIVITVAEGDLTSGGTISAQGSGNVRLETLDDAGSITLKADVVSEAGHLSLVAGDNLTQAAGVKVETADAGDIFMEAVEGYLLMAGSAVVATAAASARLKAEGTLTLGIVSATNLSVISVTGDILNAAGSSLNLSGTNLRVNAGGEIGKADRHLSISVENLSAFADAGGIYLTETNGVTVTSTRVVVTEYLTGGGVDITVDAAQSDLTTANGGNIVLVLLDGNLLLTDGDLLVDQTDGDGRALNGTAVSANGGGHIRLEAASGAMEARADVVSGSGLITMVAEGDLEFGADADVVSGGSGQAVIESLEGNVTQDAGATVSAGVVRIAAEMDITLGAVNGEAVSMISRDGAVLKADASGVNVTAGRLRLNVRTDIGAADTHLDIAAGTLTAHAAAGGIHLTETDGLTVSSVRVAYSTFAANADIGDHVDESQSDLVTGLNGNIILVLTAGNLLLGDGDVAVDVEESDLRIADGAAVSAGGSGSLLLQALAGSITAHAGIFSGTGHLTLKAQTDIFLNEDVEVKTAEAGTVSMRAFSGAVEMHGSVAVEAEDASLRVQAAGNIVVANLKADAVSLVSGANILNAAESSMNITAEALRIQSLGTAGTPTRHLTTTVNRLSASTAGLYLSETAGLEVTSVEVTVTDFLSDADTEEITDAAQADLVTQLNGNIILVVEEGSLVLNDGNGNGNAVLANGSGRVLLQTQDGSIVANADIRSGTGDVTVLASENITLNENVDVVTAGPGTAALDAQSGFLLMHGTVTVVAGGSSARIAAEAQITLGNVTAQAVSLVSRDGQIGNAAGTSRNVTATDLRIESEGDIGKADRHLTTQVANLSVLSREGSVAISENNAVTVTTVRVSVSVVQTDAGAVELTDLAQSDLVTLSGGNIIFVVSSGDLTLNDGRGSVDPTDGDGREANQTAVTASGSGNIRLETLAGSVHANANVLSGSGLITLRASQDIHAAANVLLQTTNANLSLHAVSGSIFMHGTARAEALDSVLRLQAAMDIIVGNLTAGAVSLVGGRDVLNAPLSTKNVTATRLRIQAMRHVAVPGRHLTTFVSELSARSQTGDIFVTEDSGLTVQSVGITVTEYLANAGTTTVEDVPQADLTTLSNGRIVLVALDGDINLLDGDSNEIAVSANGSGSIRLDASRDLLASADILSGTGHITLRAGRHITLNENVDVVTSAAGIVSMDAETGALTMDGSVNVAATNSTLRVAAQENVTLGNLSATAVSVVSRDASVVNAAGSSRNVTAARLRLNARNALGEGTRHLTLDVDQLSALARDGGMYLTERDGVEVTTVRVPYTVFNANATLNTALVDTAQSDLVTLLNGNIVLVTDAGDIVLNDGDPFVNPVGGDGRELDGVAVRALGSGRILLQAAGSLFANATVQTQTGHATLRGAQDVTFADGANLTTGGTGTLFIEAVAGNVTLDDNSLFSAVNGDIRVLAGVTIRVGGILTQANVSLIAQAGSILDAGDLYMDVTATQLRMVAGIGIGTNFNAIETEVAFISGRATSGGIYLLERNAVSVGDTGATIQNVNADGSVAAITDQTQSDLRTTAGNGSIVLQTTDGTVTLTEGSAPAGRTAIAAHGAGNILINTIGVGTDIVAMDAAGIVSATGHISLRAARTIRLENDVDFQTGGSGTFFVEASSGAILMHDNSRMISVNGDIRLRARENIELGGVHTEAFVSLTSLTASILTSGTAHLDVTGAMLRLIAAIGVGTPAAHLRTDVGVVSSRSTSGGFYLHDTTDLLVDAARATVFRVNEDNSLQQINDTNQSDVRTLSGNGNIVLRADGSLTLNDSQFPLDNIAVQAHGSGSVRIWSGESIQANANVLSATGLITVRAVDNLTLAAGLLFRTAAAGQISLDAETGNLTMHGTANVEATASIARLRAGGTLTLGNVTATTVSLLTQNGQILNAANSTKNVTAVNLRIDAGDDVGVPLRHLTTNITNLTVKSGGGIHITEDNHAVVTSVRVDYTEFEPDAQPSFHTDFAQSDLRTLDDGDIILQVLAGNLVLRDGDASVDQTSGDGRSTNSVAVEADGSGSIHLRALLGSVEAQASVLSGSGHITVKANQHVDLLAEVQVQTAAPGQISLNAELGELRMHGTATVEAADSVARLRAQQSVLLGNVVGRDVSVISTSADILNAAGSLKNLTAASLRLIAQGTIGVAGRHLSTDIGRVTARAATGGIYLTEDNGAEVSTVRVDYIEFNADATQTALVDLAQSDLVTLTNGNIVLVALAGDIVLQDGDVDVTQTGGDNRFQNTVAVTAHGSGSILLHAAGGSLTANASLLSGSGLITVRALQELDLSANVLVETAGPGLISLDAVTGSLTMNGTATVRATGTVARIRAGQTVTVGNVISEEVSILAVNGAILNADGSSKNVTAARLCLESQDNIGDAERHLTTDIDRITALSRAGSVYVTEDDGIEVSSVRVAYSEFVADASTTDHVDAAQSDLVTQLNGNIVLIVKAGNLALRDGDAAVAQTGGDGRANNSEAVRAHGSGSVRLQTELGAVEVFANLLSGTGHITLKAKTDLDVAGGVRIETSAGGNVSLDAETGNLILAGSSEVTAVNSVVRLRAQGTAEVSNVRAADVSILAVTGAVINAAGSTLNVEAVNLRLEAHGDVGSLVRPLTVDIDNLSALSRTGDLVITEKNGATVTSVRVDYTEFERNAAETPLVDAAQSDLTTLADGNIVFVVEAGDLTLTDGDASVDQTLGDGRQNNRTAVSANGGGHVRLEVQAGSLIALTDAGIRSDEGDLTLQAKQNLVLNEGVDIVTEAPGTVSLQAVDGTIQQHGTVRVEATDSAIRLEAAGDITLGNLEAEAVSLVTTGGAVLNAADSKLNVTADRLRIDAWSNVGASGRHLTVDVDLLSVLSRRGSMFMSEQNGVTVDTVSVTVNRYSANGTREEITDGPQSDLVTLQDGDIVLVAVQGAVTLNDGQNDDGIAVSAQGSGNVLILAMAGSLEANADILSDTGHITLKALNNIGLTEDVNVVTSTPGTVSLDAETGVVTMHGSVTVVATGSSVRITAEAEITLANVTATDVSIVSRGGDVINAAGTFKNVTATNLRIEAEGEIGASGRHITTNIDNLTALSATGSMFITEDNGVTVTNVSVTVTDFNADASSTVITDEDQSDLVTLANGDIVLVATQGDVTLTDGHNADGIAVSAEGNGNVLIRALAGSLDANADILSDMGHITLKARNHIDLTENVDVVTSTPGTISLDAETGDVTMHGSVTVVATDSSVRIAAEEDITLANVTATDVSLVSREGDIINAADTTRNVTATNLRIEAEGEIGASGRHITTNIDNLTALSSTGSMFISEADGVTVTNVSVTVTDFNADASSTVITDEDQSDLVTLANGDIVLVATLGNITLTDGHDADGIAVTANGNGNVLIRALAGSLEANADILSDIGHITLKAAIDIDLAENVGVVTSMPGTISLDAETGDVTMQGSVTVVAADSSVRIAAEEDITLANVTAADVSLVSREGDIINAVGTSKNITATNLRIEAEGEIGASDRHLTTNIDNLTAVSATGSIFITEDDGVTVTNVSVTVTDFNADASTTVVTDENQSDLVTESNGDIVLVATQGDITLTDGHNADGISVSAEGEGNVLIRALAGSLDANADILSDMGHITLKARNHIDLTENVDVVTRTPGTISLDAETGDVTMQGSVTVVATGSSVRIAAEQDITLGNVAATHVSIVSRVGGVINAAGTTKNVTATNLRIEAGEDIGAANRHITTNLDNLTAVSATGSLFITEDNGVTVTHVSVTVTEFNADATTSVVTDADQSDLVTGINGDIVLVATLGDITLNDGLNQDGIAVLAGGTGSILLETLAGSVTVNAGIFSGSGNIRVLAKESLILNEDVEVATDASASVFLLADTGSGVMEESVIVRGGAIRIEAELNLVLATLEAAGDVSLVSRQGALLSADAGLLNVTADRLRMEAENDVGPLRTKVNLLAAVSHKGSVDLEDLNTLTLGMVETSIGGVTDSLIHGIRAEGPVRLSTLSGRILDGGDLNDDLISQGPVTLTAAAGLGTAGNGLEVTAPQLTVSISAAGSAYLNVSGNTELVSATFAQSGNLYLNVGGDLLQSGAIALPAGSAFLQVDGTLTVDAMAEVAREIRLSAGQLVFTAEGTWQTAQDQIHLRVEGDILMAAGGRIAALNRNLRIQAGGSVTAALLEAGRILDVRATGDLMAVSNDRSTHELRALSTRLDLGGTVWPVLTRTQRLDVRAAGVQEIHEYDDLTTGFFGLQLVEPAPGDSFTLRMNSATLDAVRPTVRLEGDVVLVLLSDGTVNLAAPLETPQGDQLLLLNGLTFSHTGPVLLAPQGDVRVEALQGAGTLQIPVGVDAATFSALAQSGSLGFTFVTGVRLQPQDVRLVSGSGNIYLNVEAGNLTLDAGAQVIHSGTGELQIRTETGRLISNNISAAQPPLVTGGELRLVLADGVQINGDTHLRANAARFSARITTGNLRIFFGQALQIASRGVELLAGGTGNLNLQILSGNLTFAANAGIHHRGSGNVALTVPTGALLMNNGNVIRVTTGELRLTSQGLMRIGSLLSLGSLTRIQSLSNTIQAAAGTTVNLQMANDNAHVPELVVPIGQTVQLTLDARNAFLNTVFLFRGTAPLLVINEVAQ